MQIHISWKTLFAGLLCLCACMLFARFALALRSPLPVVSTPTVSVAANMPTAGATVTRPAPILDAPSVSTIATVSATPEFPTATSFATASAIAEPTLVPPSPTAPPPSPTPFQPPTRIPTPVRSPAVVVAQGFGQEPGAVSYALIIHNPNTDMVIQRLGYIIALFDAQGLVLATDEAVISELGPDQHVGVAKRLPLANQLTVDRIEVTLRPSEYLQGTGSPQLPVENPAFVPGAPPSITGIVRNTSDQDLTDVQVVGIAYEDSAIVGGGTVAVSFVPAQGQMAFSIPLVTSRQPTRVEVFASLAAHLAP